MDTKTETVSDKTDNELIAEFMGGVFYSPDDLDYPNKWFFTPQPHEGYQKDAHHLTVGLRYDRDWSWLMPVVQKIYKLYDEFDFKSIKDENMFLDVLDNPVKYPISDTYRRVVEFIKWHNSQPHK